MPHIGGLRHSGEGDAHQQRTEREESSGAAALQHFPGKGEHERGGDVHYRHVDAELAHGDSERLAYGLIEDSGATESEAGVDAHHQAAAGHDHVAVVKF